MSRAPVRLTDRGHGPGYVTTPRVGWRARVGWRLRCWADRIDRAGAPKIMSGWSFTFEDYEGIRFREDGWGCRLAYIGDANYSRAHDESDTAEHARRRDAETRENLRALGADGDALAEQLTRILDRTDAADPRAKKDQR